ncbi:Murein hydrolase activator NlpD precursor [Phaeobacter sp. CECT 5382]|uniref:peptidoglycan DD-metalloendopeptidase family protein n=1 Tax=Rhodobacterales TaxID=204455 RepID=UPI0006DA805F|nr:peptidoglycan DD-metalloendopeptidase family protein [Phaeobacter sp. CECT 5382]CUH86332.1 Murein hydrolase activator NlpD precursor [Phaeobacter sp. CECT 5382]
MTGSPKLRSAPVRMALVTLPLLAVLAGCENPLDYDLRGQIGGFNTTQAAQSATSNRPTPDARGLITYPSYQVAVAQRGDKVSDLAARIGLPAGEIAKFNGMQPSDPLRKGEVLALPRRAPTAANSAAGKANPGAVDIAALAGTAIDSAPATSPNPGSVTTTEIQPKPQVKPVKVQAGPEPVRHKVVRGETAYTISRLYQVPVKSLAEWNGLGSDFAIREGQHLMIPLKDQSPARTPAAATSTTAPGEGSATPTPPSATKPLPEENIAPADVAAETLPTVDVPEPSRPSTAAMAYPVQGKIVKTYAKGRSDGIDIAAAAGASVKAAESGTVAVITKDSDNIPLIVIRHDPKLSTIYFNVDKISVTEGDQVKRGQTIATLHDSPQALLHFEVRDGFDSQDPLLYLN